MSDQFIFRLVFRLYRFPKNAGDRAIPGPRYPSKNAFLEQKRRAEVFAARKSSTRIRSSGRSVEYDQYLLISALPLDIPPGNCAALRDGNCGIYERRPLSCRTVPAHYSRAEALAERDFDEFTKRPGYRCATDPDSEIILDNGRIVMRDIADARARAIDMANADQAWNTAILRRMTSNPEEQTSLPSLKQIQDNARYGAMTTSMRVAWQIARDMGLLDATDYLKILGNQLRLIEKEIEKEIAIARASRDDLDTLAKMQVEYQHHVQPARKNAASPDTWLAGFHRYWRAGEK